MPHVCACQAGATPGQSGQTHRTERKDAAERGNSHTHPPACMFRNQYTANTLNTADQWDAYRSDRAGTYSVFGRPAAVAPCLTTSRNISADGALSRLRLADRVAVFLRRLPGSSRRRREAGSGGQPRLRAHVHSQTQDRQTDHAPGPLTRVIFTRAAGQG